jgi:hypothetical protein
MTPPATARPTNTAPATTTGAILASGAVAGDDEKEGSTTGFIFALYVCAITTYNIFLKFS